MTEERMPREFWLRSNGTRNMKDWDVVAFKPAPSAWSEIYHVREVIEPDEQVLDYQGLCNECAEWLRNAVQVLEFYANEPFWGDASPDALPGAFEGRTTAANDGGKRAREFLSRIEAEK